MSNAVNASEDGDEPIGEAPELTMPRVASPAERQTQAVAGIRALCANPFDVLQVEYDGGVIDVPVVATAAILAVFERHGLI